MTMICFCMMGTGCTPFELLRTLLGRYGLPVLFSGWHDLFCVLLLYLRAQSFLCLWQCLLRCMCTLCLLIFSVPRQAVHRALASSR